MERAAEHEHLQCGGEVLTKTWLISDTHFGHDNIYKFQDKNGNPVRKFTDPWTPQSTAESDELMVYWWQKLVAPDDKIYHLGDIAIKRKMTKIIGRLPGRKVLIRGNHDIWHLKDFVHHFEDIRGTKKIGSYILTHYPIHPDCIPQWCTHIIHGHIHEKLMKFHLHGHLPVHNDDRYINVCVEHTGGKPIDFQDIIDGKYHPAKGKYV